MLDISSDQVLGGELEPEEKEELAEKIGKMLQRDRCGVSQMAVRGGDAGGENSRNTVSGCSVSFEAKYHKPQENDAYSPI